MPRDDWVATWCGSSVTVRTDPAGNHKPDEERSTERFDLIIAAITAIGRTIAARPTRSRYENPREEMLFA